MDGDARELQLHGLDDLIECGSLCKGEGVLWLSVGANAASIRHTDRVGVLSSAVSTSLGEWTTKVDMTIDVDEEVVPDGSEATLTMPAGDIFHRYRLRCLGGSAMDDEFVDGAHSKNVRLLRFIVGGCQKSPRRDKKEVTKIKI